jgi:hypothetical protein
LKDATLKFCEKYAKHFQNEFHNPAKGMYQVYVSDPWLTIIDGALIGLLQKVEYVNGEDGNLLRDDKGEYVTRPLYDDFQIHQIKEKFGQLRFYYSTTDANTSAMLKGVIAACKGLCSVTCLECGKHTRDGIQESDEGYWSNRCNPCRELAKRK